MNLFCECPLYRVDRLRALKTPWYPTRGDDCADYLDQFLFHFTHERAAALNSEQRLAVHEFLRYVRQERSADAAYQSDLEELDECIHRLKANQAG